MALMLLVVFPLAYALPGSDAGGCLENVGDAVAMVRHSRPLQLILLAFFVSVAAYNIFAIYVRCMRPWTSCPSLPPSSPL